MNIIFFNTIFLGDYLIHSNVLNELKKKYNCNLIAVCSPYNSKIISKEEHIDEIIIYDHKWNFLKKLNTLKKILSKKYFISFVGDAQPFSYFANFIIKSKYKRGIITRKIKKYFFEFSFYKPFKFIANIMFDRYEIQTRPKYLKKKEYLPKKFINLFSDFEIKNKKIYFFNQTKKQEERKKILLNKINFKKYITFHMDHKWNDIKGIEKKLHDNIDLLQKKTNYKILIFVYKNKNKYFKIFEKKNNVIDPSTFKIKNKNKNKNIFIVRNASVFLEERIISNSSWNISCHSGFFAQTSAALNKKIIDIIPKKQVLVQSCWVPNRNYFLILKKSGDTNFDIDIIFQNLISTIIRK